MKHSKIQILFLRGTKICLMIILFTISCYWGYQACLKVYKPPVGTRLQYRYGDDFKGNVEIMAITVCPDAGWYYKFLFLNGNNTVEPCNSKLLKSGISGNSSGQILRGLA